MGIARPSEPRLLLHGHVESAVDIKTRPREDAPARVFKKLVTIDQGSARLQIDVMLSDSEPLPFIPGRGEPWAVVVGVRESREYGASLVFVRAVDPSDLNELADAAGALAALK